MRVARVIFGLGAIALAANSAAQAAIITSVTENDPAVANIDGSTFNSSGVTNNNDIPIDVPGPAGEVALGIDVYQLHTPFTLTFERSPGFGVQEYLFTIGINNFSSKVPINQLIVDINGSGVTFDEDGAAFNPSPTGGTFVHDQPTNRLTFTGFSISPGSGRLFTFSVDIVSADVSNFDIVFTANPEPASMALAGLASCGLGGLVVRRRRKANAKV